MVVSVVAVIHRMTTPSASITSTSPILTVTYGFDSGRAILAVEARKSGFNLNSFRRLYECVTDELKLRVSTQNADILARCGSNCCGSFWFFRRCG
jgi:hypothetical protein